MAQRPQGWLIAFDGIDSSGKATQTTLLTERFAKIGRQVVQLATPDYTTPQGQELKRRLQNQAGDWQKTSWQEKLQLFAANRQEHREKVVATLEAGGVVVYDRYVPSSLAFIAVEACNPEMLPLQRKEIYDAVEAAEYLEGRMPREHISIFLDVDPRISERLLRARKSRRHDQDEYTDHLHLQERLYEEYLFLCQSQPQRFLRIPCLNGEELRLPAEVAELVWQGLQERLS